MPRMNTPNPLTFLSDLFGSAADALGALKPPQWLDHELRHRLVLLLNHVVQQEPQAQERLLTQQGKAVLAQWRQWALRLSITPAGLFALADEATRPDLTMTVEETSPLQLARSAMLGERPQVHIVGDVELAAHVNWLAENLRWDGEEDLSRLIGDVPAHTLAQGARTLTAALKSFVDGIAPPPERSASRTE